MRTFAIVWVFLANACFVKAAQRFPPSLFERFLVRARKSWDFFTKEEPIDDTSRSHVDLLDQTTTTTTRTTSTLSKKQVLPVVPKEWILRGVQLGCVAFASRKICVVLQDLWKELEREMREDGSGFFKKQDVHACLASKNATNPLRNVVRQLMAVTKPADGDSVVATLERILTSLTKTEASLLQECLFVPSPSSPSWKKVVGFSAIQSALLDQFTIAPKGLNDESSSPPPFAWDQFFDLSSMQMVVPRLQRFNPYAQFLDEASKGGNGILFYGPPGCGKSLLLKSIGESMGCPCLVVTPSVLIRTYVGETNQRVRALFSLAQKLACNGGTCVICLDELDGLLRERQENEQHWSREVKTEFLQWWDGLASEGNVLVVGATNRPFEVDAAALRRMPRSFFLGLPNERDRQQLLEQLLSRLPTSDTLSLHRVVQDTLGFSFGDLTQLVRTAVLRGPMRDHRRKGYYRPLTDTDLTKARAEIGPTPLPASYCHALWSFHQARTNNNNKNNNNTSDDDEESIQMTAYVQRNDSYSPIVDDSSDDDDDDDDLWDSDTDHDL